jgi:hypothetical protein
MYLPLQPPPGAACRRAEFEADEAACRLLARLGVPAADWPAGLQWTLSLEEDEQPMEGRQAYIQQIRNDHSYIIQGQVRGHPAKADSCPGANRARGQGPGVLSQLRSAGGVACTR